jgi:hypothetical protein
MWCLGGLGLVGIGGAVMCEKVYVVDSLSEVTQMASEMTGDNNETKVEVLSKATYTAKQSYDCILCHKPIKLKSHYVRVVVKPVGGEVQTQRWCLPCWLG